MNIKFNELDSEDLTNDHFLIATKQNIDGSWSDSKIRGSSVGSSVNTSEPVSLTLVDSGGSNLILI